MWHRTRHLMRLVLLECVGCCLAMAEKKMCWLPKQQQQSRQNVERVLQIGALFAPASLHRTLPVSVLHVCDCTCHRRRKSPQSRESQVQKEPDPNRCCRWLANSETRDVADGDCPELVVQSHVLVPNRNSSRLAPRETNNAAASAYRVRQMHNPSCQKGVCLL